MVAFQIATLTTRNIALTDLLKQHQTKSVGIGTY